MQRRMFLTGIGALALAGCESAGTDGEGVSGRRTVSASSLRDKSAVRFRHLDAVNAFRQERGLGPVAFSQALNSAAVTHARDMALQQRAWHFGSDRSNPASRAARAGFGGRVLGENIAETFDGDLATLQDWLNTPQALGVILNSRATSIGFGWYQEPNGKLWWVQILGGTA